MVNLFQGKTGDYKSEIEILLDSLDKSVNSNTAWLHFGINSTRNFELQKFLLNQLRTGFFHFSICENDINRGWEHYVSIVYSKDWKDTMIMLPKPGNSWNGNEHLTIEDITEEKAKDLIIDLLTGEQKYFSKSSLGTPLDKHASTIIFDNFIRHIKGSKNREATFYNIKPDFLSTVEDYYNSDYTKLGYFENSGRDFALGILLYEKDIETFELKILLTNGYS